MNPRHWVQILVLFLIPLLNERFSGIIIFGGVRHSQPLFRFRHLPNASIVLTRLFSNTVMDLMILLFYLQIPQINHAHITLTPMFINLTLFKNSIFLRISLPNPDICLGVVASRYLVCEDRVLVSNGDLFFKAFFLIVKFFYAVFHHKFLSDNR